MRQRHKQFKLIQDQGLTLVELLIAMAVLSIAMLGAVGMFPVAHQHIRAGGDLTKATGLAQRMVELLRDERFQAVARYHNADTRQTSSFPADDLGGDPPFRGGSWLQRWREEISSVPFRGGLYQGWGRIEVEPIDRGLLAIRVTVGWPAFPTERTVELATYLAQQ
jgi:prepilin-type N-terminal cleavage/methylation domain-containing protein